MQNDCGVLDAMRALVEEGCTHVVRGRSRMTKDPRVPQCREREHVGCSPTRYCLHQARGAVRCWASRMKVELHRTENRLWRGLSCIWRTASNELICFLVWPFLETAMGIGYHVTATWVPYHMHTNYVKRSFPLYGVKVTTPHK